MEFGIFDYVDQRDEPAARTFDERMALLRAAEDAGFRGYHLTEHHATPLSLAPSPTPFLAAAARETKRLRLGTLLYLLPLHHPLRLIEELCMLDHLSHGRLDIGLGTGVSPFEFAAFGADFENARDAFEETFEIVYKGLSQERLHHHGRRHRFDGLKMVLRPYQQPLPPLWYGLRTDYGHPIAARYGMNVVTLGPDDRVAQSIARFRKAWTEEADARKRLGARDKEPLIGAMRAVVVRPPTRRRAASRALRMSNGSKASVGSGRKTAPFHRSRCRPISTARRARARSWRARPRPFGASFSTRPEGSGSTTSCCTSRSDRSGMRTRCARSRSSATR